MDKKTILIVDDEKDVLEVLGMRFTHEGYDVLKAANGKKCIETAKKNHPDLIILDIILPDLDGATVASLLKESPETKDIPIIFLSCLITKEGGKNAKVIKGRYYVAKPYNPDELVKIIHKYLS